MCTYNAISSHTDHFEIQNRDLEKSLLTFVNLFPRPSLELPFVVKTFVLPVFEWPFKMYFYLEACKMFELFCAISSFQRPHS